jgi:hypothetical protein
VIAAVGKDYSSGLLCGFGYCLICEKQGYLFSGKSLDLVTTQLRITVSRIIYDIGNRSYT